MKTLITRLLSFLSLGIFSVSAAFAGVQQIYECGTIITEPGNYQLVADLVDCPEGGVTIAVSDVKLNLKGHTITCETNDNLIGGVVAVPHFDDVIRNVEIRNGYIHNCNDGIALLYAQDSKIKHITSTGNREIGGGYGTGITVAWSSNNTITHNHTYGNALDGIFSFESSNNVFKHNLSTDHWSGSGIWMVEETGSKVMCNETYRNYNGIALGPDSTGNILRGNAATGNFEGIGAFGYAWEGYFWRDIPSDNVFARNIATGNYFVDLEEVYFDVVTWDYLLHPENECQNTWMENDFGTTFGPVGCFDYSVDLNDDVCALEDED
jgi:parallel beta-helix repeat protein